MNVALITLLDPFIRSTESDDRLKMDVSAFYTQVQERPSSLLLLSYQSSLSSSLTSGAVMVLVASYGIMLVKVYIAHLLRARARSEVVGPLTNVRVLGEEVDISGVAIRDKSESVLSDAFWMEDEGNSEIWKKAI